jgi:hypothetical protein
METYVTSPDFIKMTADAHPAAPALPARLTRLAASAGVTLPTTKISVAALDKLLAGSKLSTAQRFEIKAALHKAGILV